MLKDKGLEFANSIRPFAGQAEDLCCKASLDVK
jgi:hypothetical protein